MKLRPLFLGSLLLLTLLLTGCNTYSRTYQGNFPLSSLSGETKSPILADFSGNTELIASQNPQEDKELLLKKRYILLGSSSFENSSPTANISDIREQSAKIGADKVIYGDRYLSTEHGTRRQEYRRPDQVIQTTVTERVHGRLQSKTITTVRSVPPEIVYVPYTIDHYSHVAFFFRKAAARYAP